MTLKPTGKSKLLLPPQREFTRADLGRPIPGDVSIPPTATHKVEREVPVAWTKDDLSEYWDDASSNMVTNFLHGTDELKLLHRVDASLWKVAGHLNESKKLIVALLFLRGHAAFRAASLLAMAGAAADTYPLTRSVLEIGGYALRIHDDPNLATVWLERHKNATAKQKNKSAFKMVRVKESIGKADKGLLKVFNELYDTSIDYGGHPNEKSVTSNLFLTETPTTKKFNTAYLHGHSVAVLLAIKSTARAGLFALHAFQHTMPEKFQILGVREEIIELRKFL